MDICLPTVDLSYTKNATQSTIAPSSTNAFSAAKAVDRDMTTCMRTNDIGRTSPDKSMWWKVDLGLVYTIHSVSIMFKNYIDKGVY